MIKFRAWDKENNIMLDWETLKGEASFDWFGDDNLIFMQSTNTFDKNGAEIYEGDILQWTSEIMAKKDWIGLVERVNADFSVWKSKNMRSPGGWLNVAAEYVEVIGNEHEHYYLIPELIK